MIKELLIKKNLDKLRQTINENKDKYLSKLSEEEKNTKEKIINKEYYTKEDISTLIIEYFDKQLENQELLNLIKPNSKFLKVLSKKKEMILYNIICYYLLNEEKYQVSVIEILNNINILDINIIEEYTTNKNYQENELVLNILNKLSLNQNLKSITNELLNIFNIYNNNILNLDLINLFLKEPIKKYNNYYFEYQEVFNKLQTINIEKNITFSYLTFVNDINIFKNQNLTKEDLLEFLKKIEEKNITLNEFQINNLLNNFSKKYYQDNNIEKETTNLKNKIIIAYYEYYEKNFYFQIEDFITYYNNLYQDDFSPLTFSNIKTKLTRNIFDSLFYKTGINEIAIILEKELINYKSFKPMLINYKITCLEEDKTYYERYKFYLMYIDKVKDYFNYKDNITIEYYMLKNIASDDHATFYELFKTNYETSSKKIGRNNKTISNSVKLLKQEYIEELEDSEFEKRYEVLNKYKKYCQVLNSLSIFNEQHLLKILKEYEDRYYNIPKKVKKRKKNK